MPEVWWITVFRYYSYLLPAYETSVTLIALGENMKIKGSIKCKTVLQTCWLGISFDMAKFPSMCLYNVKHEMEIYVSQK